MKKNKLTPAASKPMIPKINIQIKSSVFAVAPAKIPRMPKTITGTIKPNEPMKIPTLAYLFSLGLADMKPVTRAIIKPKKGKQVKPRMLATKETISKPKA